MAAVIKISGDLICQVKNKKWSCESAPDVAAALQQLTDEFFELNPDYYPDKDEALAVYATSLIGGSVISVDPPEELPAGVLP